MSNRPYITCHMTISVDGKVTGSFLGSSKCKTACEAYYRIHKKLYPDAFVCGRVTMEESFTEGWYPDLSNYQNVTMDRKDYIAFQEADLYAVAFDRKGRLGWKTSTIVDDDPGYGGAHIIEVLCEDLVSDAYLAYLRSIGVSYIFGGKTDLDLKEVLAKLFNNFYINNMLLEGGSDLNESFASAGVIDELSLVQVPLNAEPEDKLLFPSFDLSEWKLTKEEELADSVKWLRYDKISAYEHPKIKLSVLVEAIEEGSYDEMKGYYDLAEHEIVWISEFGLFDDEETRELMDEEPDRFLRLPNKYEINEYGIMEDFIDELPNGRLKNSLARAIEGRGAFRRFKDGIIRAGIEDRWYAYQSSAYREIAIRWCDEEEIAYEE